MFKAISAAIEGVGIILLLASPVAAQSQCGPRDVYVKHLTEKYEEGRHMMALTANGMVMEIYGNEATGSWTAMVTRPDGVSCVVASGSRFELMNDPAGIEG